jgi:hypothetical protein
VRGVLDPPRPTRVAQGGDVAKRGPVLLVERDSEERDLIGGWLENAGYDVLACPGPSAPDYTCIGGDGGFARSSTLLASSSSICGSPVTRRFREPPQLTSLGITCQRASRSSASATVVSPSDCSWRISW